MLQVPAWGHGNLGLSLNNLIDTLPGGADALKYVKAEVASEVKLAVKPYFLAAYAVGGAGLLVALVALARTFR